MNTRFLLGASSVVLGIAGLAASFAPVELLGFLQTSTVQPLPVLVQIMGALYVAFALANWAAKDSLFGGIYARPLAIGNGVHFVTGALVLLKYEWTAGFRDPLVAILAVYGIFGLAFGYLLVGRGAACAAQPKAD